MVNEIARENEIAWIDYAASLDENTTTGRDLRVARLAFMAGRASAQKSTQQVPPKPDPAEWNGEGTA